MKTGKIQPAVRDRSVLRVLKLAEERCAAQGRAENGKSEEQSAEKNSRGGQEAAATKPVYSACAAGPVGGRFDLSAEMILTEAVNHLVSLGAGAASIDLQLSILLAVNTPEEELKDLMQGAAAFAAANGMRITGGDTAVSDAVTRPVLSVTAIGYVPEQIMETNRAEEAFEADSSREESAVVMAGYAGWAGTAVMASAYEQDLRARFPSSIVDAAMDMRRHCLCRDAAEAALRAGNTTLMQDISRGGVFAALWELAQQEQERTGLSMDVDLYSIPIRQETIEICERYDLNPYQLFGQGAILAVTTHPAALVAALQDAGIPAAVIGHTAGGRGCRVHSGEDVRYLEKPQQDALWKHAEKH